jgi:Secretion system C-terminal sorting domain
VHVYEEAASYNVCLIVSNSNGTDTICRLLHLGINTIHFPTGITDQLIVYPNPFTSSIKVKLFGEYLVNSRISIYDVHGYRLADQQWDGKTLELDLSILQPGIYFYRIQMVSGSVISGRIMKVK